MVNDMENRAVATHARRKAGGAQIGRLLLTAGAVVVCALGVTGALDPTSHMSSSAAGSETGHFGVLPGPVKASVAKAPVSAAVSGPAWARTLPADTTQVLRTVRTTKWCAETWCAKTEAWEKVDGAWQIASRPNGKPAVFRSQIGVNGFANPDSRHQGDMRTPTGTYGIVTTFSTTKTSPTAMPWRRRLPTSAVSDEYGKTYNTWVEIPGNTSGTRRMMSWGLWIDWNHPRLVEGLGPAPVTGRGSGIFMHTSNPGHELSATAGCVQLGDPDNMAWVVRWLKPDADPRIVNNR
jgi:L,D-peptidoglycan transpeptidase YkuD (ErfK/YbiS/YcfS/YnhG family)